jgi:hypothetical protein
MKAAGDGVIESKNLILDQLSMSSDNEQNSNLAGTSAETFYVQVGSSENPNGVPLAVSDGDLTSPSNIRVWDINPTRNKDENYSSVTFKWNWSDLDCSAAGTQVVVQDTAFSGETVDVSTSVGKRFYFTSTGNSYRIQSVSSGSGSFTLTLEEAISGSDEVDSSNPGRIVDDNVKEYIFSVRNIESAEVFVQRLDVMFVRDPRVTIKLPLGETYNVTMRALNQGNRSELVTMSGGSYNPDWADGQQGMESYNADFKNELPDIPATGDIELVADSQGFIVETEGWVDSNDHTKTAHAFEILYSSQVNITSSSFQSLTSGRKERDVMYTRLKHISSGSPRRYSVGVRPLQNGQPVGDPIIKEVTSGGGGILPSEQVIATIPVDIEVTQIVIENPAPTPEPTDYDVSWRKFDEPIRRAPHAAAGEFMTHLDGAGEPIYNETYRINEHLSFVGADHIYRLQVPELPTLTVASEEKFATGVSKEGRKIAERKLDIDYRLTKMEFDVKSVASVSSNNPGIIRVYQKGLEGSGAKMEITGYQSDPISQTFDLPVRTVGDGSRTIILDGWDPDNTSPNNTCEFSGTLTIIGRPFVIDNLS